MNRSEEYAALISQLDAIPNELETTVERAMKREKTLRFKRFCCRPAVSLAACFAAFVMLVNVFPTFAKACEDIPVIGDLAKAVTWSPSLTAAVENEYVQPIGKSQTVNGITATIQYLIVDQKQVNIFFTLDGEYENLTGEQPDFIPEQKCSRSVNNFNEPPGSLLRYTLNYGDEDVPSSFTMTFGVTTYEETDFEERPPEQSWEDEMLQPNEPYEPDILAEFTFDLEFDPDFTAKGEIVPVNTSFDLDGQTLTVTEAEIYPTHTRVKIQGAEENTAWLKGVQFYLENEDGEQFRPISNGVSAMGDPDSPAMLSFHLESPYFAKSKHLTLYITQVEWLDKELEKVRVDLNTLYMDRKIEGVRVFSAEHREGGWLLSLEVERIKENHSFTVFSTTYYDAQGKEYHMDSQASSSGESPEYFREELPLKGYHEDAVWLVPLYSHRTDCSPSITVPIK